MHQMGAGNDLGHTLCHLIYVLWSALVCNGSRLAVDVDIVQRTPISDYSRALELPVLCRRAVVPACSVALSTTACLGSTPYSFTATSCLRTRQGRLALHFFHVLAIINSVHTATSNHHQPTNHSLFQDIHHDMANVQLIRARQTFATTTINQVQSIQLVQTMLHGAMSTLTYLRELFPEKAFADRYYEMRETPLPYAEFAAARMPSHKGEADEHSTRLPVLIRERSRRADLFLDWLVSARTELRSRRYTDNTQEKGVFPELDSGELRAVQLLIHPNKESRDTVLETYTFTVHYTVSEDGRRTPSGLGATSSGSTMATAKATNTALQQLLRSVSSLCRDLPVLPGEYIASPLVNHADLITAGRLMSMELIYENNKGKQNSVEGFVPSRGDELSFAKAKGWNTRTQSLEFTTGHHE
jgi:hypothetical protein